MQENDEVQHYWTVTVTLMTTPIIGSTWYSPIQNTVVQSIELQGNRCGTDKSRQNSRGTGRAKFAGTTLLMTVKLTDNTGMAPVKEVPPAKVMSPWSGGTGIARYAGAAPLMTVDCHSRGSPI